MIRCTKEGMTLVSACEKQLGRIQATITKLNGAVRGAERC
jgi:hypothetical protein